VRDGDARFRGCGLVGLLLFAVAGGSFADGASAATGLDGAAIDISVNPPLTGALPDVAKPDRPAQPVMTGNPLWAVPLGSLSGTRERPLFSPSRRQPAPVVVAAPVVPQTAPPPKPAEPDHPLLTLVGTIVGGSESVGIFSDPVTKGFIRLKIGEDNAGWTLRSIFDREATFEKDSREATLVLPARGATGGPAAAMAGLNPVASGLFPQRPVPQRPVPQRPGTWKDGDGQLVGPPQSK
jgi:general secretion pathway protein N